MKGYPMLKRLLLPGMLAAVFVSTPVSAQTWTNFRPAWDFCSGNSLSACMNFQLTRYGTTNDYRLLITYVSSLAHPDSTGFMTSAGLYRDRRATDVNVSNLHIVSTTPTGVSWSIGSTQLSGDGPITIEVAGNSDQGITNGLPVGGNILLGFRSTNLATYNIDNLYARSHIQGYGVNECSLKPDSRAEDNLVGTVADVDAECGTATVVPEPVTMVLLGSGLLGIGGAARRRRKKLDIINDA
jgi:hypothetical protein